MEQQVAGRTWRMLIGGEWCDSSDGRRMEVLNPARGEVLGYVPLGSADDVGRAVAAAKAACQGWWRLGSPQRIAALHKLAQRLRQHADELAWLDAANGGNPIRGCEAEVMAGAARCEEVASLLLEVKGETVPASTPDNLHYTVREPIGVVGVIMPFNHPLFFALDIIGPLAVGNTVVLKPSDQAPLSALRLGELCEGIFPPGVVNIVSGDGATTGSAIAGHPDVRLIFFRGSVPTGQRIMQLGAERAVKRHVLELGGKNPLLVCPDADLPQAVRAAVTGMNLDRCQGQSCMSTSRVLVHRSVKREFVERLAAALQEVRLGDPTDPGTQMGSLVTPAHRDRVMSYVRRGKEEGARLVVGGAPPTDPQLARGAFLPPTLFDGAVPSMTIAQEEIFGPVVTVLEWETEEEAVAIANGVRYGLTASVWTNDLERAHQLISRLEASRVFVNSPIRGFPGTTATPYKDSGIGADGGLAGLMEFTRLKAVHIINQRA